jgi:adenosine deaminase/aminodeoxyfutalosine deaminase
MREWLRALDKAELHVHLEGAIEPETLLELEPSLTLGEVQARYEYADFLGFLKSYAWAVRHLASPADFALIARRLLDRLAAQGVSYVELNLSVGVMLWRKQDARAIIDAVLEESRQGPVETRLIFDAVRQFDLEEGWETARLAAECRERGVVGFGIGGDEGRGPAGKFREVFAWAKAQGLRLAPHAGETGGPESVWAALEMGAERIGHGIRSIEDPQLVKHLREHGIPLEISISSNVRTGAVASLEEHPVRRLYDAGVPVVLNTDDPAMFHTTLLDEYELAARAFGFSEEELRGLAAASLRHAFRG